MKNLDVSKILGSKEYPWFILFELHVDRQSAAPWFSCPPHVDFVEGVDDADHWAVEFDCGLKVAFEFLHCNKSGIVYASQPVAQHVRRHLKHWQNALRELPPEDLEPERSYTIQQFANDMPELTRLNACQLWRQGDDGNQVKIGEPTSLQDATCWQAELESHKHKQIYWISRVESPSDA